MSETQTQTAATETQTAAEAAAPAEKKQRGQGIGKRAIELITEGKTNKEVLDTLKAEFPDAHTTMASVNWYRNKLRKDGVAGVKSARELAAEAKAKAAPAEGKAEQAPAQGGGLDAALS